MYCSRRANQQPNAATPIVYSSMCPYSLPICLAVRFYVEPKHSCRILVGVESERGASPVQNAWYLLTIYTIGDGSGLFSGSWSYEFRVEYTNPAYKNISTLCSTECNSRSNRTFDRSAKPLSSALGVLEMEEKPALSKSVTTHRPRVRHDIVTPSLAKGVASHISVADVSLRDYGKTITIPHEHRLGLFCNTWEMS